MPTDRLYLLSDKKCAAAIHLFEKHGFVHDPEIMRRYGSTPGTLCAGAQTADILLRRGAEQAAVFAAEL